jgi:hypothetical protein
MDKVPGLVAASVVTLRLTRAADGSLRGGRQIPPGRRSCLGRRPMMCSCREEGGNQAALAPLRRSGASRRRRSVFTPWGRPAPFAREIRPKTVLVAR